MDITRILAVLLVLIKHMLLPYSAGPYFASLNLTIPKLNNYFTYY